MNRILTSGVGTERSLPEDYRAIVDQVAKENETGFLPKLKTRIDSIQKYEVVFIGLPTWGTQLPIRKQARLEIRNRLQSIGMIK